MNANDWITVCDSFTRDNTGKQATLYTQHTDSTRTMLIERGTFDSITADMKDGEHPVEITFGTNTALQMMHTVNNPTNIAITKGSASTMRAVESNGRTVRSTEDASVTTVQLVVADGDPLMLVME